jgi:hypothetical protein
MFRQIVGKKRVASAAVIGGLMTSVFISGTASAASISAADCASQSGRLAVRAVAISQGDTITLQATPPDGKYVGQASAQVFCQAGAPTFANLGDIPNAQISVQITPDAGSGLNASQFTVEGVGVPVTGTNPATLGPFTGSAVFNIVGASNILPPGTASAHVGVQIETVTGAWGGPLLSGSGGVLKPGTFGDVLAQTPELDSLALFASGVAGLIGYATLRRRARNHDKGSSQA